jgi:uncharacterized protein
MPACLFASDLHGHDDRYVKLVKAIAHERPAAVFLGGDLLPHGTGRKAAVGVPPRSIAGALIAKLRALRDDLRDAYPRLFVILGNDDPRIAEDEVVAAAVDGLWEYVHNRRTDFAGFAVYGYACVPPTPFLLKDWERYDVSRHVDPGCVSPEDGWRTVDVEPSEVRFGTISRDLAGLFGGESAARAIILFHAPPYRTALDRAALDTVRVEHVAVDVHVGSIALRRFIEERQPLLTLHGHVHEAPRLTGAWRDKLGSTHMFSAAHDGPELALVHFDPEHLEDATRELL